MADDTNKSALRAFAEREPILFYFLIAFCLITFEECFKAWCGRGNQAGVAPVASSSR